MMTMRRIGSAILLFALAACQLEEDLKEHFEIETDDYSDIDEATLSCTELEFRLAINLPRSAKTAANEYDDMTFVEWCRDNIMRDDLENYVGNAAAWEADENNPQVTATSFSGRATRPYPAHGARLDLHVLRAKGTLPFARKVHYADWEGPKGTCALEMRIYQQDIGATGKKALLYLHGGGWRNRTTTLTAAEVLTSHLVDSHVVFMPAYPLNRDKDGPEECRHATFEEISALAQRAFEWVQQHRTTFGASAGTRIDLMGHSAGGQLAAWLATQNAAEVGKFVNFYGPTEFANFIDEAQPGGAYAEGFEFAKRTIAYLFGVASISELKRPYDELIMQNSLSEIVAAEGTGAVPPFLTVQGSADTTVPVEQAVISCNAIGGNASTAGADYSCGSGSRAIIVEGAHHNLDRRCVSGVFPARLEDAAENAFETYCPTAAANPTQVRLAVQAAYDWIAQD